MGLEWSVEQHHVQKLFFFINSGQEIENPKSVHGNLNTDRRRREIKLLWKTVVLFHNFSNK